jgi:O-antigen/teichoic acid export membrane protein
MNIFKTFIKDTSIYSLQPIITKLLVFALLPIYTSYLTVADYGNLDLILTYGAFFFIFIDLGLVSSFWKYRTKSLGYDEKEVIFNILLIVFAVSLILFFFIFIYLVFVNQALFGNLILIFFFFEIFRKYYMIALVILQADFKAGKYVLGTILYTAVFLILNIIFITYYNLNYSGVIYSYSIAALTGFLYAFPILKKKIKKHLNIQLSKKMIEYGFPLMIGNLAAVVITLSSRFFLKQMATDIELGQYSYGFKYASLVQVILNNSFFLAWNPIRWKIYEMENGKEIFAKFYRLFLIMLPVLTFVLVGSVIILMKLITMDVSYLGGVIIILIVASSFTLHGLYYFNSMGMLFENKTRIIMYIITATGIINLILNFFFISLWGIFGAAVSMLVSYLFMFIVGRYYSQKYYPIRRESGKEFFQIVFFIFSISFLTILYLYIDNLVLFGFIIICYAPIYFLINLLLKNITLSELMLIKTRLSN